MASLVGPAGLSPSTVDRRPDGNPHRKPARRRRTCDRRRSDHRRVPRFLDRRRGADQRRVADHHGQHGRGSSLALRASGVGQMVMGEVGGRTPDGFDLGNSPFEASRIDFRARQSFNAPARARRASPRRRGRNGFTRLLWLPRRPRLVRMRTGSPDRITLVAMGKNALERTDEDELCALHLRNLLDGPRGRSGRRAPGDPGVRRSGALP